MNMNQMSMCMHQNKKIAWERLPQSGWKVCGDEIRKWAEFVHHEDASDLVLVS